jgi:hypothetical protein
MADYAVAVFIYFRTASSFDKRSGDAHEFGTSRKTLVIYATGAGQFTSTPPDGSLVTGLVRTVDTPTVAVRV